MNQLNGPRKLALVFVAAVAITAILNLAYTRDLNSWPVLLIGLGAAAALWFGYGGRRP